MEVLYRKRTLVNPTYNDVHTAFKLNGFSLDREDLCRVAYSFIKEGEGFERAVGHFLLDWFDQSPFIQIATSGTTGEPKIINIEKQAMVNSAVATGEFFDIRAGSKALHCLPTKYIAGKMMFVRGFILGLDMDFVAPSLNPLENCDVKYDFAAMVPLQAQSSIDKLHLVKTIIIGGVRMGKSLEQELMKLPCKVYETYGMTETITHIAAKEVGETAFTVLPDVTISYNDKNCLVIHAPRISEGVIETNDLVELVNENQFKFIGRADHVVNSGGIKLIPEQIEEKLSDKIPGRFFVCGVPDETLGERLILVIEGQPSDFDRSIFDALDKYERPKDIRFVAKFVETGSGKLMRKETVQLTVDN